jgi:hypothetical protein
MPMALASGSDTQPGRPDRLREPRSADMCASSAPCKRLPTNLRFSFQSDRARERGAIYAPWCHSIVRVGLPRCVERNVSERDRAGEQKQGYGLAVHYPPKSTKNDVKSVARVFVARPCGWACIPARSEQQAAWDQLTLLCHIC